MFAIDATGIVKSFGDKKVLDGINLKIQKGNIHAILGPNGSGKTTLIKILATLLKADEGNIRVGRYSASVCRYKHQQRCVKGYFRPVPVDTHLAPCTPFRDFYR